MGNTRRGVRVATLVGLLTGCPAWAAEAPHNSFSLLVENDLFYNTDRDYTSGLELAYTTAPDETPDGLVDFAHALPLMPDTGDVRASFSFGQDIFTPANTQLVVPPLDQRPYAGWLYAGLGLLAKDEQNLDQLEFQIGTIGPASLGRDSQAFVHSILGERKPAGWHYQLRDEPTLEITYERAFKLIPPKSILGLLFDIEPHVGAAAGNVYDYVNAGGMARFGFNLPDDFGPVRMQPTLPGTNFFEPTGGFSAYVFAGIDARALARNIFLDGNSFEASRSVPKKDFVGDLQLGAAIATERWRLSFTHVFRSKEYKGQPRSDQFGAVNLTFLL